jgi:hypothetical protein
MDIEVAVNGDGMDIGIFGSENKLGGLTPSVFISMITRELEELLM